MMKNIKTPLDVSNIEGIDKECIELCNAINKLDGLYTTESCCGHGRTPYHIFFNIQSINNLLPILHCIEYWVCGLREWRVLALTDSAVKKVFFLLEGPIGNQSYLDSKILAKYLNAHYQ